MIENLVEIMKDSNKYLAVRATIFLGEFMNLGNKLLPRSQSSKIQILPGLFAIGVSFKDEFLRNTATSAINHLEKLQRAKEAIQPNDDYKRFYFVSPVARPIRRLDRIQYSIKVAKARTSIQIDGDQVSFPPTLLTYLADEILTHFPSGAVSVPNSRLAPAHREEF